MAIRKYSHGDHMAQLGRVTGLLEAQNKIQQEIIKEQKKLRIIEHNQLIEKIKGNEKPKK
jgi:hypothetical protein